MSSRDVLINAARRFEAKRDLAGLSVGGSELEFIRETVANQPGSFYNFITEVSPELGARLNDEISPGMSTRVVDIVEKPADGDEDALSRPEDDIGVFYYYSDKQQFDAQGNMLPRPLKPRLVISTAAVKASHGLLDPLFSIKEPSNVVDQNHLLASIVAPSWIALGRWAFEKMDPRRLDESLDIPTAYRLLHGIGRLSCEDCLEIDPEEEEQAVAETIDSAMLEVKYRFAGTMAYAGLMLSLDNKNIHQAPDRAELKVFQLMRHRLLEERAMLVPSQITTSEFALSMPLGIKTAVKIIDFFLKPEVS